MFIIIEGVDKNGKTSLANYLSNKYGIEVVKFSQPKGDPYNEYMNFLLNRKEPAILDRFYLGELVYGPVKRGKAGLNEWQVRNIELLLRARFALPIYCETNEKVVEKNFIQDKEEFTKIQELPKLKQYYERAIFKSRLIWKDFDYLKDREYYRIDQSVSDWHSKIESRLDHIKLLVDARCVGSFFGRTLILGEECNYKLEKPEYSDVIVPFANGPSAEILYSALASVPNPWMISNIKKFHVKQYDNSLLNGAELALPSLEKVVLLGNNAMNLYMDYGMHQIFPHYAKVPHPAFVARGGMSLYEYSQIIKNTI